MKSFGYKIFATLMGLMLLTAGGCGKSEFTILFDFPNGLIGNYIVTYYAWDDHKGMWLESVASLQEGKAEVHCATVRPTLVYLRDASSPTNSIILYAEKGDKIKISGENSEMSTWTVTGNELSKTWSEWRKSAAGKPRDKAIEDFVRQHRDSKLSAIILLTEWDRSADSEGFIKLWNSLAKEARDNETIEMCGCQDFPGVEFNITADGNLVRAKDPKLRTIIVRSRDNGTDTLNLKKAKASLLYFFTDDDSDREIAIDTIKSLTKQYPDSARRIITDISSQPDSITWMMMTRRDTLKGVVRAWMPHGLADKNATGLGIAQLPWIVVTGKGAKELYSGTDLQKATAAFRLEMNKKDK